MKIQIIQVFSYILGTCSAIHRLDSISYLKSNIIWFVSLYLFLLILLLLQEYCCSMSFILEPFSFPMRLSEIIFQILVKCSCSVVLPYTCKHSTSSPSFLLPIASKAANKRFLWKPADKQDVKFNYTECNAVYDKGRLDLFKVALNNQATSNLQKPPLLLHAYPWV